jgi:hypothetical protein
MRGAPDAELRGTAAVISTFRELSKYEIDASWEGAKHFVLEVRVPAKQWNELEQRAALEVRDYRLS